MTMDMAMDMHVRGGLRVEAAAAVLSKPTTASSPASSESSDRTGSPNGSSPAASPAHNNNNNNNNNKSPPPQQTINNNSSKMAIKRSFDVAFLMAPDDLSTIKKRHQEQEQQLRLVTTASLMMRSAMTPLNVAISEHGAHAAHTQQRLLQQHPPSLMVLPPALHEDQTRSAFTKVTSSASLAGPIGSAGLLLMQNPPLPTSPSSVSSLSAGGLSPDHSTYQNSLSPSPGPTASTPTSTPLGAALGTALGAGSPPYSVPPYQQHPGGTPTAGLPYGAPPFYVPGPPSGPSGPSGASSGPPPPQASPSPTDKKARRYSPPSANGVNGTGGGAAGGAAGGSGGGGAGAFPFASYHKLRPTGPGLGQGLGSGLPHGMLYPDSLAAYTNLAAAAAAAYPFGPAPAPAAPSAGSALAAAVSASLMPPTFAALSLPAQNVCAKCNVSFRMTSDLVYHMRAHHKSDHAVNDPSRRRREQDKLKCPVCAESFRERHHLTRHMTAHQDKDGDAAEEVEPLADLGGALCADKPPASRRHANNNSIATSLVAGSAAK